MESYTNPLHSLVSRAVTLPFVKSPFHTLDDPSSYELENCKNLRIAVPHESTTSVKHELGAWLLGPTGNHFQALNYGSKFRFPNKATVFLYLHGNTETRAQFRRVKYYSILQAAGYYLLSIDYRGFGDSTCPKGFQPDEPSMVEDANTALLWIRSKIDPKSQVKLVVNGHSLGTGVACGLAKALQTQDHRPSGYLLLAPFNTIEGAMWKGFPWITYLSSFIVDIPNAVKDSAVQFNSEKSILSADQGEVIWILHAEDDVTVPFELGQKLYMAAKSGGLNVKFITYPKDSGIGHDYFINDPDLAGKIQEFVEQLSG